MMENSSSQTDNLHRLMFKMASEEEPYMKYYTPKEGDTVIDAGAHVGIYTTKFSKLVGTSGIVYAIEPDYRAIGLLMLNTENCGNVRILPYALWDSDTIMQFYLMTQAIGVSSCVLEYIGGDTYPIKGLRLDTIVKAIGIKKINFIKMDIEASELHALEGMTETLKITDALAIASYHRIDPFDKSDNPAKTYPFVRDKLEKIGGFNIRVEVGHDGEIVYANR